MNKMNSFEIWDLAHGMGKHRGKQAQKIGAIKELRFGVHEVFGPANTPLGDQHGFGLKAAKDYIEQEVMSSTMPKTDSEYIADAFYMKADPFWMGQNGMSVLSDVQARVNTFYKNHVPNVYPDPPAPTPTPVVEMTGQIIGWRAFRYENQRIRPLSHRIHDFKTVGKTIDTAPDPDIDNEFGFWCFKKKSDLLRYAEGWTWGIDPRYSILYATILLTGEIVEHDLGYRAKEIEILGLYSNLNNSQRRGIAHKLGWYGKVLPTIQGLEEFPNNLKEV
jgi:hypothetical protein